MNQKWRENMTSLTQLTRIIYTNNTDLVKKLIDSLMWLYLPYSHGIIRYLMTAASLDDSTV